MKATICIENAFTLDKDNHPVFVIDEPIRTTSLPNIHPIYHAFPKLDYYHSNSIAIDLGYNVRIMCDHDYLIAIKRAIDAVLKPIS